MSAEQLAVDELQLHEQTADVLPPETEGDSEPEAPRSEGAGPVWRRVSRSTAWPALAIAGVRVLIGLLVAEIAVRLFGVRGYPPAPKVSTSGALVIRSFLRWDGQMYRDIAISGYPTSHFTLASFFPLYPLVARGVMDVTGGSYTFAALAVSWLSLWLGVWGLIRLIDAAGIEMSWRGGVLLAFFPVSVFLIAGYPESMFFALAAWSLVALFRRRPWPAAVLCGLASATRPEGFLLALAIVGWTVQDARQREDFLSARMVATLIGRTALAVSGQLAYMIFLWNRFGTPFEQFRAEKVWHRQWTWPFHPLFSSLYHAVNGTLRFGAVTDNHVAVLLLDDAVIVAATISVVALALWVRRRRRELWWLLPPTIAAVLLVVSSAPFGNDPQNDARLLMTIAPLYLMVGRIRNEVAWSLVLVSSVVLCALFQGLFNSGQWLT